MKFPPTHLYVAGFTHTLSLLEKEYQEVQIGKCDPWPLREMLET